MKNKPLDIASFLKLVIDASEAAGEDLILYKLIYFGLSQQSIHSQDIAAILKSKKNGLDLGYIEGWATRLGLSAMEGNT